MLLGNFPNPFFVLAPMDDVTDSVFRQIVADCAKPDLFFTEFVNVDGLQSPGRPKLIHKLAITDKEKPIIAQLWGKTPENYFKTAQQIADGSLQKEIEEKQNLHLDEVQVKSEARSDAVQTFAGVDINMGCPVRAVVKNGCCIALADNRGLAGEIIESTKNGAPTLPVSVKTRLGLKKIDLSWIEFLLKQKLNMLTIHGRTAKEMSKVPANWEIFEQIVKMRDKISPNTLLIGNGDVLNKSHGLELAKKYSLDGIMVGRAIFNDPFVFADESLWADYSKQQKIELFKKHVKLYKESYKNTPRNIKRLNKFCKIYINGFDGAKELREKLMSANTTKELIKFLV